MPAAAIALIATAAILISGLAGGTGRAVTTARDTGAQTSAIAAPFTLVGTAQVQPVGPMPTAARKQGDRLEAELSNAVAHPYPGVPVTLPGSEFDLGTPESVVANNGDAVGRTLTYFWVGSPGAPVEKCGSYYFPSFIETDDGVFVYIGQLYGPNSSPDEVCPASAKLYSAQLHLRRPMGSRYLVDVVSGLIVPLRRG